MTTFERPLVVDGHVMVHDSHIYVDGTDSSNGFVQDFTTGDVAIGGGNGGFRIDSADASRFQFYGTSQMHFAPGRVSIPTRCTHPETNPKTGRTMPPKA